MVVSGVRLFCLTERVSGVAVRDGVFCRWSLLSRGCDKLKAPSLYHSIIFQLFPGLN